jgi:hypothetical protein
MSRSKSSGTVLVFPTTSSSRRRAAALQVTKDHGACFLPGQRCQRLRDLGADSAEPLDVRAVGRLDQRLRPALGECSLGNDDDAELGAQAIAVAKSIGHDGEIEGQFGNQDRAVAPDGDERVEPHLPEHLDDAVRIVLSAIGGRDGVREWIAGVSRAEDRASESEDPRDLAWGEHA